VQKLACLPVKSLDFSSFVTYKLQIMELRQHPRFAEWLQHLPDRQARARIIARLTRLEDGLFGDVKPVGAGVSELRLHFGAGYRIYFVRRSTHIILLLCGGDKSTQAHDIRAAQRLAQEA
jgi:putative addiction module killer protein